MTQYFLGRRYQVAVKGAVAAVFKFLGTVKIVGQSPQLALFCQLHQLRQLFPLTEAMIVQAANAGDTRVTQKFVQQVRCVVTDSGEWRVEGIRGQNKIYGFAVVSHVFFIPGLRGSTESLQLRSAQYLS